MNIGTFELEVVRDLINEVRSLKAELAASQAREKVLREAHGAVVKPNSNFERASAIANQWPEWKRSYELTKDSVRGSRRHPSIPTDDTALRQAIRAAKEEMRERCAKVCDKGVGSHDQTDVWDQGYDSASRAHAAGIRTLEVE